MTNNYKYQKKDQGLHIKSEVLKYLRFWYWFVLSVVVALLIAYLYLRYTPRIYQSQAKISILDERESSLDLYSSMMPQRRFNLDKEVEILKSYPIIKKVVNNQDLTVRFFIEGNVQTTEVNSLPFTILKKISNDSIQSSQSYRIEMTKAGFKVYDSEDDKPMLFPNFSTLNTKHDLPFELVLENKDQEEDLYDNVYYINLVPIDGMVNSIKNGVNISSIGEYTDLLRLSYTSQSKEKNERILNELIAVFNQDGIEDRRQISLRTIQFIDARFESLASELDSIETDIKQFKESNEILSFEAGAEYGLDKLNTSREELFDLENQLMLVEILEESLKSEEDSPQLLPANIGVTSGNVNALVSEYNQLVLQYQKEMTSATEKNPLLISLKRELRNIKSNIFASIGTLKKQLQASKSKLEQKSNRFSAEVFSIPAKQKMFLDIKRQQEIKQELYVFLLQKREEAAINYAITEPTVKVIEYAISSNTPVAPKPNDTFLFAVVLGLALPFGIIYLSFLLDTKIKSKDSITAINPKNAVVGELPKMKNKFDLSFITPNDNSIQAEAYRVLGYNLNFSMPPTEDRSGKVIYCTSSIKGEGKTHVSVNLSLAFSSLNKKTLLIGGDLRNPQIHNFIGRQKEGEGLSNYLYDIDFDWKPALIKNFDKHPQHDILLSGKIPPDPAVLFNNGRLEKLLAEAKKEYDIIIMDTAPTLLVSDTLLISSYADMVVYLTRANYTDKKLLEYSKELASSGKLKNMVYVVNAIDIKKANAYGYGYGYNYGYNYGYGAKSK